MKKTKRYQDAAERLRLIPTKDQIDEIAREAARKGRCDDQLAPLWAEKLKYTYTKPLEMIYPEYAAANGDVLPIDTSVPPSANEWEYFVVDKGGFADFIDDDGQVMPTSFITAERKTGKAHEIGHGWDLNIFDLERAAAGGLQLSSMKSEISKRAHDATTNWVWLFGDDEHALLGLCNHPNISVSLAPLNNGATSRLWSAKSDDEIMADIALLIDSVPVNTIRAHFVKTVYMPLHLVHECRNRRLGQGDGFASLWDLIKARYGGDETGQGKVEFKVLNECDANLRQDPRGGGDTSGISGDFLLACPAPDKEVAAFMRMRPYTTRPPQERDFVLHHATHSKIGGCKMTRPLAFHRLDFVA